MKKRYSWIFLLLFLCLSNVKAQAAGEIETETMILTEENRYDSDYYQQPKVRYPLQKDQSARAAGMDLESYIVDALEQFQEEIDVSAYKVTREEAFAVFFQILNSHSGLFYVERNVSYSYSPATNLIFSYNVKYLGTKNEVEQQKLQLEAAASRAVAQTEASMSDLEKALAVHDYLIQNCEYDYDRLNNGSLPQVSHTAYGALVNKMAVCDGYGNAYCYIMKDKLGISCEMVSSPSMNHAWNLIEIEGKWYHVDNTWDDPVRDCMGRVGHNYFLLSDQAISDADHGHQGWSTERKADSMLYDDFYWSGITSAICPYQGEWYYSLYEDFKVELVKRAELLAGGIEKVYAVDAWNVDGGNSIFTSSFMFLSKADGKIYFNDKDKIWRLKPDGTITEAYEPAKAPGQLIFGFAVQGKNLCYALQNTPQLVAKQQVLTHALPELNICPGHQYQSKITKAATETQKGIKTYICIFCGESYTEEIPMLKPARPGNVTGLKVTKNLAGSLTFTWKRENNVSYRLVFYKGNQVISTKYVTGNIRSYGGLKPATEYMLRVTPYRLVNGTKVYAAGTGTVHAATAPAAATLQSVKKSGSNKVKLVWKRVSGASGYEIFMKTEKGSYQKIKTIAKGNTTSFVKSGMKKGKKYSFRLYAYKAFQKKRIPGAYSKVKIINFR